MTKKKVKNMKHLGSVKEHVVTPAEQLIAAQAEAAAYLEGWQRAKAELDNYRKTVANERAADQARSKAEVVLPLLVLADNFRSMTKVVPEKFADDAWAVGVLHIARQLDDILKEFGVQEMPASGEAFDPMRHEAVGQVADSGAQPDTVVEVVQAGYLLDGRVLRPAKVVVRK